MIMEIVCYITTYDYRSLILIIDTNRTDTVLGQNYQPDYLEKKIHRLKEVIDFYTLEFEGNLPEDLVVDQLKTFLGVGEDSNSSWKLVCAYKI